MPGPITLLFLLTLLAGNGLMAQETIGLQVDALTSAERDSIISLGRHNTDIHMIYACVPAGMLVFAAAEPSASREALRTKVLATVAPVIALGRFGPAELTLHEAEVACETARGQ